MLIFGQSWVVSRLCALARVRAEGLEASLLSSLRRRCRRHHHHRCRMFLGLVKAMATVSLSVSLGIVFYDRVSGWGCLGSEYGAIHYGVQIVLGVLSLLLE